MDSDPWNWDAGQVVTFFRDRVAHTLPEMQRSRLPPSEDFFTALESEGVTGDCLLTSIDNASLRDEFGVRSSMTRSALWSSICRLRAQSAGYAAQHSLPVLQAQTPRSLPPPNLPEVPDHPAQELALASVEEPRSDDRVGENARSGEYQVQDAQGRKRRKLDLSATAPQAVATQKDNHEKYSAYLPDTAKSINGIFYGNVESGDKIGDLPADGVVTVLEDDRDDGLEFNDFQIQRQDKTVGESQFVYRRMARMLREPEIDTIQRQGRDALVMFPYRAGEIKHRSTTVIQFTSERSDSPVAFREDELYLDRPVPEKHKPSGGEWAFLTEMYAASEDTTLPALGESVVASSDEVSDDEEGENGEEDNGSSMAEESIAPDDLGKERASDIIDGEIKAYYEACDAHIPRWEEKKAYTVWKQMHGSKLIRKGLIEGADRQIEYLQRRLAKQKSELLGFGWDSELDLKRSCRNLEGTVEDIESQRWQKDVWGRKKEPWHDASKQKAPKQQTYGYAKGKGHAKPLIIPDWDRFSVEPPSEHGAADTAMQDGDDGIINIDTSYEADDEQFHTPVASPEPQQQSPDAVVGAEESDDHFVVDDDADDQSESGGNAEPTESGPVRFTPDDVGTAHASAVSGAESEELPSPSQWKTLKREPQLSTPSAKRTAPIDLTAGSPSSDAATPASKRRGKQPRSQSYGQSATDNPDWADAATIDRWNYEKLVRDGDRKRILLKLLRKIGPSARSTLYACYLSLQRSGFMQQLRKTLESLSSEGADFSLNRVDDPLPLAAAIYVRWHCPELLTTASIADIPWASALIHGQLFAFSCMLGPMLQKHDTPKFNSPPAKSSGPMGSSTANAISLSSDGEMPPEDASENSRKPRRRKIEQSQTALNQRQRAHERMRKAELAESQSAKDSSQLAAMVEADPTNTAIVINPKTEDDEDNDDAPIYVARHIAGKMKPHQINGARFLWREITASAKSDAEDEDGGRGCVLAHTMGLGKTMQTIALLAAVNETAHSKKFEVRKQLPKHLRLGNERKARNVRILILCPPGLIQNWNREIQHWVQSKLGNVSYVDSSVATAKRYNLVQDWMRVGGVLIVGYQMFLAMVKAGSDSAKPKKKTALAQEDAEELLDHLLTGPQILVADEAHNLKNEKSGIAMAAKRIKTESKIALTGTPMSNDVQEIYALVSWVSPDYLGEPAEFRQDFAVPIQEGLYVDSSHYYRRKSIMKLKVLHEDIRPKVHRANIEALRGSIPPKVEFVIFVSLQETQRELYRRYIKVVKGFVDSDKDENGKPKTSQAVFWSMLSVLTLLTGHPCCFRDKLLEPPKEKKGKAGQDVQGDGGDTESDAAGGMTTSTNTSGALTPLNVDITTAQEELDREANKAEDAHVSAQGLTPHSVEEILGGDGSDIEFDPALSTKMTIFLQLLRSSLAAKDRAIVFSQRLGTLNYLGQLLEREKVQYGRIDGSNMSQRMPLIAQFEGGRFNVMLVSTRAGGVGLNMQCANRVFIFDSGFNPTYEEQAIGRAYRLGQRKHVYVYRFVAAGTFETNLYNKQLFKTSLAQRVVDKKNPRRNAERNARDYLYEPLEVDQQDITEHIAKDEKVLGKLLQQHGQGRGKFDTMIRDVKTMETLTEEIMDAPLDEEEQKVVQAETEARKQRPRGRKAAAAMMAALPSTMPNRPYAAAGMAPPSSTMLPHSGWPPPPPPPPGIGHSSTHAHPVAYSSTAPPPPSTYAGASNASKPGYLGGLPNPRR